jgi:Protein of unknown function (DUF2911)
MKMHAIILGAALLGSAAAGFAEQQTSVAIDGNAITVKYTPPAAKKRLMASLHTNADLAFKGVRVPKGDYTVYVLTDSAQWQIAINKAIGTKAATYDAKLDLGRVNMTMGKGAPTPDAKVTLTKIAALAAKLEVAWNDVVASAPFHLDRGANDREW